MRETRLERRFKGHFRTHAGRHARRTRAGMRGARESCYQSAAHAGKSRWCDRKADVCKVNLNLDRDTERVL